MRDTWTLHRFVGRLDAVDRARIMETGQVPQDLLEPIARSDGSPIRLTAILSLMAAFQDRRSDWSSPERSDQWLAPRLHSALRLTRAQAADKDLWHWLAVAVWPEYVEWRWGKSGEVMDNRWYGPVNKQAFARLWWGGELFRKGADYSVVEQAFKNQDLINSLLHRPVVRCRSLALGIVKALWERADDPKGPESDAINDLARVLNLSTAGSPPEAWVGFQTDDILSALRWAQDDASPRDTSWANPLPGPEAEDVHDGSIALGRRLAERGIELAERAAARMD